MTVWKLTSCSVTSRYTFHRIKLQLNHGVEVIEQGAIGVIQELYPSTGNPIWATVWIGAWVKDQCVS